jgi:hypothetical protein
LNPIGIYKSGSGILLVFSIKFSSSLLSFFFSAFLNSCVGESFMSFISFTPFSSIWILFSSVFLEINSNFIVNISTYQNLPR